MLKVGDFICDMHGTNLGVLAAAMHLQTVRGRQFQFRNAIEFLLPDRDDVGTGRAQTGGYMPHEKMIAFFNATRRYVDAQPYTNKYLIVVGEPLGDSDWYPAGYIYDGRRVGFCEVREVK